MPYLYNAKPERPAVNHKKRSKIKRPTTTKPYERPQILPDGNQDQRLHHEIMAYMFYIQPSAIERRARSSVFRVLQDYLEILYKGRVKVLLYGSVATGLGLPNADLDFSLIFEKETQVAAQKKVLRRLQFRLQASGLVRNMEPRIHARVPVLRGITAKRLGGIGIDLTVNNPDGADCAKAIRYYVQSMPALRPLIFVLKSFLADRNLNDAAEGGLSSYSLTCMCISFLQLNPKQRPKEYIENPEHAESLGILLKDFFQYYASDFPYADSFISVRKKMLLPKSSVDWVAKKIPEGLAIECLVKERNDVGRATRNICAVRKAFHNASETLLHDFKEGESALGSIIPFEGGLFTVRPNAFPATFDLSEKEDQDVKSTLDITLKQISNHRSQKEAEFRRLFNIADEKEKEGETGFSNLKKPIRHGKPPKTGKSGWALQVEQGSDGETVSSMSSAPVRNGKRESRELSKSTHGFEDARPRKPRRTATVKGISPTEPPPHVSEPIESGFAVKDARPEQATDTVKHLPSTKSLSFRETEYDDADKEEK